MTVKRRYAPAMRGIRVAAALAALFAVAAPADATHRYQPMRDDVVFDSYAMEVHSAPGSVNGAGSWAWTYIGYHPNGWRVYSEAPSKAATLIRNLEVDDRLTLSGYACCDFVITDTNATVYAWTVVPEDWAVLTWTRVDGTAGRQIVARPRTPWE